MELIVLINGPSAALYRRGSQTTLRCFSCKGEVVNGKEKPSDRRQVCVREMNESESLLK